jgi:hypothetical protein
MKKSKLLFLCMAFAETTPYFNNKATVHYTPTMPATEFFQNKNANAAGSRYAAEYGHGHYSALNEVTRKIIYDAAPKQFMDLKLLYLKSPEFEPSDEFKTAEMGYGRSPIVTGLIGADIAAGTTQVIPVVSHADVAKDMIIVYADNSRGTITNITNTGNGANITVTAQTGKTLPVIAAAAAGTYQFAFLSEVEADGVDYISNYSRAEIYERYNYIQLFSRAVRFGRVERIKLEQSGKYANYVMKQKENMEAQLRISLSNVFWNGVRGEVTLANGMKAKTTGGVIPIMEDAGAMNVQTSAANLIDAFEDLVLSTEFGAYGETRYAYMDSRLHLAISKRYKSRLTRYTPNDSIAKLMLNSLDLGSSNIVFVPMPRFKDPASFPSSFKDKIILLDQKNISSKYIIPENSWETDMRGQPGGEHKTYLDMGKEASLGIGYDNPLAGGILTVSGI